MILLTFFAYLFICVLILIGSAYYMAENGWKFVIANCE
jgi:hypothetical protein